MYGLPPVTGLTVGVAIALVVILMRSCSDVDDDVGRGMSGDDDGSLISDDF
jgi:hypothetical protein